MTRGRRETARVAETHRPQREAFRPCGQVRQEAHSSVRKPWIQSSIVVVMPETLAVGTPAYSPAVISASGLVLRGVGVTTNEGLESDAQRHLSRRPVAVS